MQQQQQQQLTQLTQLLQQQHHQLKEEDQEEELTALESCCWLQSDGSESRCADCESCSEVRHSSASPSSVAEEVTLPFSNPSTPPSSPHDLPVNMTALSSSDTATGVIQIDKYLHKKARFFFYIKAVNISKIAKPFELRIVNQICSPTQISFASHSVQSLRARSCPSTTTQLSPCLRPEVARPRRRCPPPPSCSGLPPSLPPRRTPSAKHTTGQAARRPTTTMTSLPTTSRLSSPPSTTSPSRV